MNLSKLLVRTTRNSKSNVAATNANVKAQNAAYPSNEQLSQLVGSKGDLDKRKYPGALFRLDNFEQTAN